MYLQQCLLVLNQVTIHHVWYPLQNLFPMSLHLHLEFKVDSDVDKFAASLPSPVWRSFVPGIFFLDIIFLKNPATIRVEFFNYVGKKWNIMYTKRWMRCRFSFCWDEFNRYFRPIIWKSYTRHCSYVLWPLLFSITFSHIFNTAEQNTGFGSPILSFSSNKFHFVMLGKFFELLLCTFGMTVDWAPWLVGAQISVEPLLQHIFNFTQM